MKSGFHISWRGMSAFLAALTIVVSSYVFYSANHSLLGAVNVAALRDYGGTTIQDMAGFEVWRIFTAQLIHAKPLHMLWNAIGILLLGGRVERETGGRWVFLLWLVAGGLATIVSPIFIEAPWNVGTGASQATFAFAGFASVLAFARAVDRAAAAFLICLVVLPGVGLDLISDGYLKPGHIAGFLLGILGGGLYVKLSRDPRPSTMS
ncbi:rhomboid family intramembrane serine protease [Mesorhizobium sp. ES1-1]|uniref:rhomboid family intramembrane serine protease n=1 Tax=Mesorhizobium sp. ES1-1 TaxID=2876629 RepID=UPI001CC990DB|nr:rhomboid family intramembrane serine protease [Mesorhizobium sp. ES1-1]MBZ9675518.1 rhomboid family intramembrane serine protease [Mesorhizobium sp. ES1-1]